MAIPKLPFFEYCLSKYSCIIKHCSNYKAFANNYYRICIGTDKNEIVSYTPQTKNKLLNVYYTYMVYHNYV